MRAFFHIIMSKQQKLFEDEFISQSALSTYPMIKKGKTSLTKTQAEFNRLNKKIASLKQDMNQLPEKKLLLQTYYKEKLTPILQNYFAAVCKVSYYWDKQYDKKELPADKLFVLSGLIMGQCRTILEDMVEIEEEDMKAITAMHLKHQLIQTGLSEKQLEKAKVKEMLQMYISLTGLKPTPKMKKAKTEEELNSLIEEYFQNKAKEEASSEGDPGSMGSPWEESQADPFFNEEWPPHQKRKMSKAELTRKLQEEQALKSVRTIYMELVKELHPDREQDEELRLIKEERMKQLTEAYKNKDLSALLTMQINWLTESVKSPGGQPDEILKGYNKLLKKELVKLENEQMMIHHSMSDLPDEIGYLLLVPLQKLPNRIKEVFAFEQIQATNLLKELKTMGTKRGMEREIRKRQIEMEEADNFDNDMDDDSFMEDIFEALLFGKTK